MGFFLSIGKNWSFFLAPKNCFLDISLANVNKSESLSSKF